MNSHLGRAVVFLGLLLACPVLGHAQDNGSSPVSVPDGTTVSTIKFGGENPTSADLKPAEQVAYLFVEAFWGLERNCVDKDSGMGRLCSLAELVKGVQAKSGRTLGLAEDPARDTNYRYDVTIIGDDCIIRAFPRGKGLGAFAMVGSPKGFGGNMYFNPTGPDMIRATKVTERGYEGKGFRR